MEIDLADPGAGLDVLRDIERIEGSEHGDRFSGDAGDNVFVGGGGRDVVDGRGGSDALSGDVVTGGDGADVLDGEDGASVLRGGPGDDRVRGGDADHLSGGPGSDDLRAPALDAVLRAGPGDDRVFAGAAARVVDCGPGDDRTDALGEFRAVPGSCERARLKSILYEVVVGRVVQAGGRIALRYADIGYTAERQQALVRVQAGGRTVARGSFRELSRGRLVMRGRIPGDARSVVVRIYPRTDVYRLVARVPVRRRGGRIAGPVSPMRGGPRSFADPEEADVVRGGPRGTRIDTYDGDDRRTGGADDDLVVGGPGADRVDGGSGTDELRGGPGDDDLRAAGSSSYGFAEAGYADVLRGGAGDDRLEADGTEGAAYGGPGNDDLRVSSG